MASTDVFVSGTGSYNTYRIPALYATTNGTLLAFCEGRVNSSSDTGNIDTVLRRSFDGGVTWQPLQLVWSDGANTCGNPTVVQDSSNGRIWLFMTWNNGQDTETEILAGTGITNRQIYSCYSDNDGASWSVPVNRYAQVQNAGTTWDATGPGRGIQVVNGSHTGRLIIPAIGRNIQSDDHGATWVQSTFLPDGSSESSIVEISGGGFLRNDRAVANQQLNARVFCNSTNQGASWGPLVFRKDLVDPICQGSTIAVTNSGGLNGRLLVFSNPADTNRDNMTIKCSLDDGVTWPYSQPVYAGSSAYSCLSPVGTNSIGLLYERDSYGKITFVTFAIDNLISVPTSPMWASTSTIGWSTGSSWAGGLAPGFTNTTDVYFYNTGTTVFANNLGTGDVTIRSLNYNANADTNFTIYLSNQNTAGGGTARNLIFNTDGNGPYGSSANIATDNGAGGSFTIGAGNGAVILADNLYVGITNAATTLTIARPMGESGGAKSLTLSGAGRLVLSDTNTYTGGTIIKTGTLKIGNGNADSTPTAGTGAIQIDTNGILTFNYGVKADTFANNITGTGTIVENGTDPSTTAGETGLAGTNTFSGLIQILTNKLALSSSTSGSGAPRIMIGSQGIFSVGGGYAGGTLTISELSGAGLVNPQFGSATGLRTLNINQSSSTTFSGIMSDTTSGRYLAVTKSGAGTLFLSGTNTYSGPTTVNQGALIVKGTVSNSTVTVNSGAVFGGNGTVTGMVSFSDGSIFTNNVGAPLTAGILNMAGNATMKFTTAIALAAGNYPLIKYNTLTGSGQFTNLVVGGVGLAGGATAGIIFTNSSVVLTVTGGAPAAPTITYAVSGGQLILNWFASQGWQLQSQTNSLSMGLTTNWVTMPGAAPPFTNIITPAAQSVFYRLKY